MLTIHFCEEVAQLKPSFAFSIFSIFKPIHFCEEVAQLKHGSNEYRN